jgi:peptide deformylase
MALREIIILPDKRLREISKPVAEVTPEIRKLADDMFESMYEAPGIGLAAIQIAEPVRLITMDIVRKEGNGRAIRAPSSIQRSSARRPN